MPEKFPLGFSKEFETAREAWAFMVANCKHTAPGLLMAIPGNDVRRVYVREIATPEPEKRDRSHENNSIITGGDDLKAGVNGIVNHADGKRYDSKSEFRRATRRAGCHEVGNDVKPRDINWKPPIERGVQGDFNVRPALKEALQKHGVK